MKYFCLSLLLMGCLSCTQNILVEAQDIDPIALSYFLEFDITDVNYQNPDEQETTAVFSNQDTEVS
ncbi:MAG: hypothetical protein AAFY48_08705, partial [Bacteroidota bacterium]